MMRMTGLLAGLALALGACSAAPAESRAVPATGSNAARHPVSGLAVVPLAVGRHAFKVELAASPADQERGLMFRTAMGPDEGMIFPMNPPRQAYFWMRNTLIPLDIIYIGPDRRVLNIVHGVPHDETPLPSAGPVSAVLELNKGRAAQLGIKPGDRVVW